MRPVNKGVSPYDSIAKYEDAEPYLNERIGRYCSFCELPIFHVPEVEHKEGKKSGGDITRWENLLYGCKYCNTRKAQKIKAGELNKWIWPDKDNTFLAFTYTNGLPKVNEAYLKSISEDVYIKTVSLFNGVCLNFCPKNVRDKDKRWQKRIETLGQAEHSRIFWNKICDTELRNMKGILERHLDYWMRQPVFDNAGVLTVGYTYPNLLMSESYNGPGSPYWVLKTFVFLGLPEDHPFWAAKSEPFPALEKIYAVKECDMLLCHRKNEVTALTAGQYPVMEHPCGAEKYGKFAYSSLFGFCVSRSFHQLEQAGTDSMLAFYVHGMYYVRRKCLEYQITSREVYARWSPVEGIEVETWLCPGENGHRRRHRITSSFTCKAYDCGFSYPNSMEDTTKEEKARNASVSDENGYSRITSAFGTGMVITALPNLNLIFPNVCIPAIEFDIPAGVTEIETSVETEFTDKKIVIGGGNCYALQD